MLILIDGYQTSLFLSGKSCSLAELRARTKRILAMENGNFPELFSRIYSFEIYPNDPDLQVDFVIDLDIHLVYKPLYT